MAKEKPAPNHNRPWSDIDKDRLQFWWGVFKVATIAKRLDRTPWGVARMATQLKLGPFANETVSMAKFASYSGFKDTQILKAADRLGIVLQRITPGTPLRSRPQRNYAITEAQQQVLLEELLKATESSTHIYADRPGDKRSTKGRWGVGKKPARCLRCGTNERPHCSKGLCASCYNGTHKRKKAMTGPITPFRGEYRYLLNFYPATIEYEGAEYYSVEHAYQAMKTADLKKRIPLQRASGTALSTSSGKAKSWGRAVALRPDWEDIKMKVMEDLLRLKFEIPMLRALLRSTRGRELINWGDRFWGVCDGVGENHLGKLLMKIREELHAQWEKTEHERLHDDG